ncbi:MAG: hypothetical protein AB1601_15170 [Planctomycetota bacterium]
MVEAVLESEAAPVIAGGANGPSVRRELERQFAECGLLRPFRRACYEPGHRLELSITGVVPANTGRATVDIERFVGGGFAGQVYRVVLADLQNDNGPIAGLQVGNRYAIKILKPPSGFACAFRDFLYFLGYQAPFAAQVHPAAMRAGVLWQKLIRRAAARRFGRDDAVCDTFATFYDERLHSFGEINEWVSGRTWKFEVDDRLFERWNFAGGLRPVQSPAATLRPVRGPAATQRPVQGSAATGPPPVDLNAAEYVHKKWFMQELVNLLHEMGAPELARQYEWWTCKSQPNALKRLDGGDGPGDGLTAIDFRAGLALLPLLPMSPADVVLIARGVARGRLVQFDRSDPERFEQFVAAHAADFADLQPAVDELRRREPEYRRSLTDLTHHHVRLLTDRKLRQAVREGTIVAWQNLGRIDAEHTARLRQRPGLVALLWWVALVPLLGRFVLKLWGHAEYRRHIKQALTSGGYLMRAWRGSRIEVLIRWHRRGRVSDERALWLVDRPVRFWTQRILVGWLPAKWHRALTEPRWAWGRLCVHARFVLDMLRDPAYREAWLLDQVRLGHEEGMLTDAEAAKITEQVKDPFIQKYLKCLAVHLCTVPITQVVMLIVGAAVVAYCLSVRGMNWPESLALGTAAAATIQFLPISPGSTARGLFVLYLMIRERDIKNYYIAAPVSFIHVIGYLAFPLQMVAHDPALARFMAGRWATGAVRFIPVFGERGALPEHAVFDLFFNLPLSLRRRFRQRPLNTLAWLVVVLAVLGVLIYDAVIVLLLLFATGIRLWG